MTTYEKLQKGIEGIEEVNIMLSEIQKTTVSTVIKNGWAKKDTENPLSIFEDSTNLIWISDTMILKSEIENREKEIQKNLLIGEQMRNICVSILMSEHSKRFNKEN